MIAADQPLPCPFCGEAPEILPKYPDTQGSAWASIKCVNNNCAVNPESFDRFHIADENIDYKKRAIKNWNARPGEQKLKNLIDFAYSARKILRK